MEADDATRNPEIFLQTLDWNPDGFETTDCLECLQILNILIYGRRVCFRLWSSRTGNVLHFPFWRNFSILSFYKKYSASLCKTTCFTPSRIPKGCASSKQSLRPFHSPSYPAIISFCLFQGIGAVGVGAFCAFFEPEYEAYYEEEQAA